MMAENVWVYKGRCLNSNFLVRAHNSLLALRCLFWGAITYLAYFIQLKQNVTLNQLPKLNVNITVEIHDYGKT